MAFRIAGILQLTRQFQQQMAGLCSGAPAGGALSLTNPKVQRLQADLRQAVLRIESLCRKRQGAPADLPNPSYRAYLWLRFLGEKKWLLSHLHAQAEFEELLSEQVKKPAPLPTRAHPSIEIKNFNYLYRFRRNNRSAALEINESFISAPRQIKETLIAAALGRRKRANNALIKKFTQTPEFRKISSILQTDGQVNLLTQRGRYFNLEEAFEALNRRYFDGKLERPRLSWSARRSRRRLGYYQPESDAITISRSLDRRDVDARLLNYILYHEMLHKALGMRESNGRRYAHTRAFKQAEKQFADYALAQELMRQFCRKVD